MGETVLWQVWACCEKIPFWDGFKTHRQPEASVTMTLGTNQEPMADWIEQVFHCSRSWDSMTFVDHAVW